MKINDISTVKKIAIRDALTALVSAAEDFRHCIIEDAYLPAWVMGTNELDAAHSREKAARTACSITYNEAQNRQETEKCPGIVGISGTTLSAGHALNNRKDQFKAAMLDYRSEFGHSFSMTALSSKELRETLLGNLKLQHLHFVQAYRHIRLFDHCPTRVGFSWAATHTGTVKLTVEKAMTHLRSKFTQSKSIDMDIKILEGLPLHSEVVIKRPLSPHLRANLTWPEEIEQEKKHNPELKKTCPNQINTPLPIFILLEQKDSLPDFNRIGPLNTTAKQARLQRKDAKLRKISGRAGSLVYIQE